MINKLLVSKYRMFKNKVKKSNKKRIKNKYLNK